MYIDRGTILSFAIALCAVATSLATSPALILTPLIKQNKSEQARTASLVDREDLLGFKSYSAFLTVDERYNSNLFFWYFPALSRLSNEVKTPWIIWLQGGPGSTSLAGLFAEMGPFKYDVNSHVLKSHIVRLVPFKFSEDLMNIFGDGGRNSSMNNVKSLVIRECEDWSYEEREFSWCDEFSMVFIDNPVGAGFSFTDSEEGFVRNMDMYADNLYATVKQLVQVYAELRQAPLYVAGESYAGRYVPALAMKIFEGRAKTNNSINLQGVILGNPVIDRVSIMDYTRVFYDWGLVDAQGALAAKPLQDRYQQAIQRGDSTAAHDLRDELYDKLQDISYQNELYNMLHKTEGLKDLEGYVTRPDVRESLHVGDIKFTFSNRTVHKNLIPDFLSDVSSKIEVLLENYRVLIYCGQLDLVSSCVLNAAARRRSWIWSGRDKFLGGPRLPWWFNNTVAGYVKSGGNFTEILVKGAGHIVPADKPAEAKEIVYNFIKGQDFPKPFDYRDLETNPKYQEYVDLRTSEVLSNSSGLKNGLIASVVLNVLLLIGIVVGGVITMRWKRENDYFNLPLSDDILTLA